MKNILIVDDNKANLTAAKAALSDIYKTTAVTSGEQALKFLEKNIPDVILLDINMPMMNGFEVLEKIRIMPGCDNVPIIFLTADTEAETEQKCFDAGAVDFIAKPFVSAVMRSRIGRTIELEKLRKSLANRLDEKIKEVSDIREESNKDALTGLWNRNYTEEKVSELLSKGVKGALFMMDMDNFKAINDNYGHQAGDVTLMAFADALRKFSGDDDIICRIGGDEFMTFIAGPSSKSALGNHAADIIAEMGVFLGESGFETNSSVSVGIAQFPEDAEDFKSLYNAADKALYCVKQSGKNSYHFYSDQSAKENRRANNNVDINNLREMMYRSDPSKNGAYMLDFDNFHYVYNFIHRIVERHGEDVNTILFTLQNEDADPAEIEQVVELLDRAIFTSLRKADVSARYSSRQVIVMLYDSKENGGQICAERILENYHKLYKGNLDFSYDVVKMETSGLMKNGRRTAKSDVVKLKEKEKEAETTVPEYDGKPRILAIDDSKINLVMIKNILSENYNVRAVTSGKEAFKFLEKNIADLILLDLRMPEMDGFEFLEIIKKDERLKNIPIICLTADDEHDSEVKCFELGVLDFITKPFSAEVMLMRINRILELERLQNNLRSEVNKRTEELRKSNRKLRRLTRQVMLTLAGTIDAKDKYTNGHSERVAEYSRMIAERLGMSEQEQEDIYYIGLLHDIGKIGVPDEIINKPSRLDEEEYNIVKTHPSIGAEILEKMSELPDIAVGAKYHHERYDGKGYPEGLKGTDIPLIARIIGVADTYDAMTSNRSYREILPQAAVKAEIINCTGTQFDPDFAKMMTEIIDDDTNYDLREKKNI